MFFAVTAYDEAGNTSSLSNTLTVSTLPLTPPGQNLIAAYGFNEGSGTVITNSATATYNGTYVGTPAWTAGKNGGGLTFSGSSGYVNMGDVNSVDGVNALTVSAWMKTTGTTEQHLVDKGICQGVVNDGPFELGANFFTSGRASFVIYKSGGSPNYYPLESSVAVNDGLWHHISATYDGSTMRMYVDGIASGQASVPGVILSSTSNALEVGGHCNGGSILWKGSVDDVRIYSRALSPAEVATDMNTPL